MSRKEPTTPPNLPQRSSGATVVPLRLELGKLWGPKSRLVGPDELNTGVQCAKEWMEGPKGQPVEKSLFEEWVTGRASSGLREVSRVWGNKQVYGLGRSK